MKDESIRWFQCGDAELAWTEVGAGAPLLLIHGWPMHMATWRKLAPLLAPSHRVVMVDLAGLGRSRFDARTDMRFEAHAARLRSFVDAHLPGEFGCLASDTGGTVARHLAMQVPRLTHLLLLNTEIPGHRPPWIRWFQALFLLPAAGSMLSLMARTPFLVRSSIGFGGSVRDPRLLEGEFHQLFVAPLQKPGSYRDGAMQYLKAIRWETVDALERLHAMLRCRVHMVWGADDPTFPVVHAREMRTQFHQTASLFEIADARLLVHEERPDEVANEALKFFSQNN